MKLPRNRRPGQDWLEALALAGMIVLAMVAALAIVAMIFKD